MLIVDDVTTSYTTLEELCWEFATSKIPEGATITSARLVLGKSCSSFDLQAYEGEDMSAIDKCPLCGASMVVRKTVEKQKKSGWKTDCTIQYSCGTVCYPDRKKKRVFRGVDCVREISELGVTL